MKITKRHLRRIIKEEKARLMSEYGGAAVQKGIMEDVGSITRWVSAILEEPEYMGLSDKTTEQLGGILGDLNSLTDKLNNYFGDVGDHTI